MTLTEQLSEMVGEVVVVDSYEPFVASGTLESVADDHVVLTQADLHDLRDTETTRELYIVKVARLGVQANRERIIVRMDRIFAVSRLSEVVC